MINNCEFPVTLWMKHNDGSTGASEAFEKVKRLRPQGTFSAPVSVFAFRVLSDQLFPMQKNAHYGQQWMIKRVDFDSDEEAVHIWTIDDTLIQKKKSTHSVLYTTKNLIACEYGWKDGHEDAKHWLW